MTLPEQELCPTRPLLLYRADVVFLALAPGTFSFSMVRTPDSFDCLAVDAVTREPCSCQTFSLLTGKITGNFASSAGSNCASFLGNPRPEPISSRHTQF